MDELLRLCPRLEQGFGIDFSSGFDEALTEL
jgi:hypothetical protein